MSNSHSEDPSGAGEREHDGPATGGGRGGGMMMSSGGGGERGGRSHPARKSRGGALPPQDVRYTQAGPPSERDWRPRSRGQSSARSVTVPNGRVQGRGRDGDAIGKERDDMNWRRPADRSREAPRAPYDGPDRRVEGRVERQKVQQQHRREGHEGSRTHSRTSPRTSQAPRGEEVGPSHHEGDRLSQGEALTMDELDGGRLYQGWIYTSHPSHGYFVYFGTLKPCNTVFQTFPFSGRVQRSNMPGLYLARCDRVVLPKEHVKHLGREHLVPVKVKSVENKGGDKIKIELLLVPDKKLLVLDLNGVLLSRYPVGDSRRGKVGPVLRPGLQSFLDFCFERFDVGCWSCCRKEIVEVGVFGRYQKSLVFVYHSEQSTSLWPRHSVVSPAKPLFLKELSKLWTQLEPMGYDATNTVLIDNHVEKFENNPLGTCLVVPDFEGTPEEESSDRLLSLGGELVALLSRLSEAPDSAASARSEPSAYVPTSHPLPPVDERPRLQEELLVAYCGVEMVKRYTPNCTPDWYRERNETPGPRAIQLRRRMLSELVKPSRLHPRAERGGRTVDSYVVCEKSDGVRYLLFVPGSRPGAWLIDRRWQCVSMGEQLGELLSSTGGVTLLDGELLEEGCAHRESEQDGHRTFLVFDVIFLDGKVVGEEPSLRARLAALDAVLRGEEGAVKAQPLGLQLVVKRMYELRELKELMSKISCRPGPSQGNIGDAADGSLVFNDGTRSSGCDGLVFTPADEPYFTYQVFKWKPRQQISVDFKVLHSDLPPLNGGKRGSKQSATSLQHSTLPLYLVLYKTDVPFAQLELDTGSARDLRGHMEGVGVKDCIVECDFSAQKGVWVMKGIRADKAKPNAPQAAWNNLEAVAEGLDLRTLEGDIERLVSEAQPLDGGEDLADTAPHAGDGATEAFSAVAQHYDRLQESRWANHSEALDPRIANIRRLNNWIKTVLFEVYTSRSPSAVTHDAWAVEGDVIDSEDVPNLLSASSPSMAKKGRQDRGKRKKTGGTKTPLRVLDLACGRGGDVGKWAIQGAGTYVGVDVSAQSVVECQSRAEGVRKDRGKPSRVLTIQASMTEPRLPEMIMEGLAAQGASESAPVLFDVIAIQFAIHYVCESEERVTALLKNVDRLLAPDGTVLITTVDHRALARRIDAAQGAVRQGEEGDGNAAPSIGNTIYRVEPAWPRDTDSTRLGSDFGLKYRFTLSSAVEECEEFVVPSKGLCRVAKGLGLEIVVCENFATFVKEHVGEYAHLLPMLRVGPLSDEEWQAVKLYAVMVMGRCRSSA